MADNHYAERLEITVGPTAGLRGLADRLRGHADAGWQLTQLKPEWGDSQRDGRYHTGKVIFVLTRSHPSGVPTGVTERIV